MVLEVLNLANYMPLRPLSEQTCPLNSVEKNGKKIENFVPD